MMLSHKFKSKDFSRENLKKFLSVLWVAQEITKLMTSKEQFPGIAERHQLQELSYGDLVGLQAELEENSRMLADVLSDKSLGKISKLPPELGQISGEPVQPLRIPPSKKKKKTLKRVMIKFLRACGILKRKHKRF
jgi:hypothetical protein